LLHIFTGFEHMVVFEFGIGKVAAGGLAKLASAGSAGTTASLLGSPDFVGSPDFDALATPSPTDASVPPPADGHDAPCTISSGVSWLWPKMTQIAEDLRECAVDMTSLNVGTAPVAHTVTAGTHLHAPHVSYITYVTKHLPSLTQCGEMIACSGMSYCALTFLGLLEDKQSDCNGARDFKIVPQFLAISAISDVIKGIAILDSFGATLAVPLRTFCLGGILLSFPASYAMSWCKRNLRFRKVLLIELAACAVSLFWLVWGTHLLCVSPGDAATAPLLFWVCFVHCIFTWSGMSCAIAFTLLSSAASAVLSTTKGDTRASER
jgi:hypothetical protein